MTAVLREYQKEICIANEEDADKELGISPENNDVESGQLNKTGYESVAKQICSEYGCRKVAITLRECYSVSRNSRSAEMRGRVIINVGEQYES